VFKKLFCNHNYIAIGMNIKGSFSVFECEKCSKLFTGGMPRSISIVIPPSLPGEEKPRYHKRHTYKLIRVISEYACTGCEQITMHESKGRHSHSFYGEIKEDDLFSDNNKGE